MPQHDGQSHPHKDDQDGYKNHIATMCHISETYSSIQVNREDREGSEYFKQQN